jgi:hypothetical protein
VLFRKSDDNPNVCNSNVFFVETIYDRKSTQVSKIEYEQEMNEQEWEDGEARTSSPSTKVCSRETQRNLLPSPYDTGYLFSEGYCS